MAGEPLSAASHAKQHSERTVVDRSPGSSIQALPIASVALKRSRRPRGRCIHRRALDPRLRRLCLEPSVARDALGAARQGEPDGDQQNAEDQEPDIPPNRSAEVIADVVDTEELVID